MQFVSLSVIVATSLTPPTLARLFGRETMSLPVESKKLHVPNLEELSEILKSGLLKNFASVNVEVVDCPDLTKTPFNLSAPGLGGSPRIADIGGPPYLIPFVDKTKNYDFSKITDAIELPDAFVIGAGAGPHQFVGTNSEMMPNLVTGKNAVNGSRVCKISGDQYELVKLSDDQSCCSLLMNIFASKGLAGKVVKISARKRIGAENFVSCLRKTLNKKYDNEPVGMGGVFLLKSGAVKCHVMPKFSDTPLNNDDDVNNWLKFFNMPAPMMFFSVFVSSDPGLDLRVEHSHGYGENSGGHYHYDVTPEEVEYEAYYNVADLVYRVDRPTVTHNVGRD